MANAGTEKKKLSAITLISGLIIAQLLCFWLAFPTISQIQWDGEVVNFDTEYLTVGRPVQRKMTLEQAQSVVKLEEAFSGSWWAPISNFLRYQNVEIVSPSPEGATFEFFNANIGYVRMTKDWLDFSVEHLSKWWKVARGWAPSGQATATERVVDILRNYTLSRRECELGTTEVPSETLVVIAYQPYENESLTKWSLAATLSSYISVGMGRIVVSGLLPEEKDLVLHAFDIVQSQFQSASTELSFCLAMNEPAGRSRSNETLYNIPKSALKKLRYVLLGRADNEEVQCWLGETSKHSNMPTNRKYLLGETESNPREPVLPRRWKYVFLTEPDILLTTRQSSLVDLGNKLKQGHILAPHRLQPIPHGSDFQSLDIEHDKTRLIPAAGPFRYVQEVDSSTMSCCDAGPTKPMAEFGLHGAYWWMQGFWDVSSNRTIPIEVAHRHILPYGLIRLSKGTSVVICGSEHGRVCVPKKGVGVCQ